MKQLITIGGIIVILALFITTVGFDTSLSGNKLVAQLLSAFSQDNKDSIDPYDIRIKTSTVVVHNPSIKSAPVTSPETTVATTETIEDVEPVIVPVVTPQHGIADNDYRVDSNTSNETKEVLENIDLEVCFQQYIKPGSPNNDPDEVIRWQEFLNDYMKSNLEVSGVYDIATQNAVRAFQQKHYEYVIAPWVPPLQARTTGYIYKTTRSMANYIIGCPEPDVFLEDPGVWFNLLEKEVKLR